jgi:two-component system sensor histidine kinase GlrK
VLSKLITNRYNQLLKKVSISKLTLLGFILVSLPLTVALLFSANKLSQLAEKSTNAIYHVAHLTQLNSKVSDKLVIIERHASQYLVLNNRALLTHFNEQQADLDKTIEQSLIHLQDLPLVVLLKELSVASEAIKQQLNTSSPVNLTLEKLQQEFTTLLTLKQKIKARSNTVINAQAKSIDIAAEKINQNIFNSLYTIPITLLIAVIFILLITKPLQLLIRKINHLEQGNFNQAIDVKGTIEVEEIAQALEMMRKRLHALELQKSSFIRHISHELKTPLAAIREGTELIYDKSVGPLNDDQQEICGILKMSVNRLQRLIEDLLDFNIVLDSTSLQDAENIKLSLMITQALELRKLDIKRKNLLIDCQYGEISLNTNVKQLSVVLDNILSNAIKYSPQNGTIVIYVHNNPELTINIVDQGPCIPTGKLAKVFDAFYQGPLPEGSQIKGSGLGLTIVKELIMRLNGTIAITNIQEGSVIKGSSACVVLPTKVESHTQVALEKNFDPTTNTFIESSTETSSEAGNKTQ